MYVIFSEVFVLCKILKYTASRLIFLKSQKLARGRLDSLIYLVRMRIRLQLIFSFCNSLLQNSSDQQAILLWKEFILTLAFLQLFSFFKIMSITVNPSWQYLPLPFFLLCLDIDVYHLKN